MFHQAQKKKHRAGVLLCRARPNEIVVHIYKRIGKRTKERQKRLNNFPGKHIAILMSCIKKHTKIAM